VAQLMLRTVCKLGNSLDLKLTITGLTLFRGTDP